MLFDTDILIWHLRGHAGASSCIDKAGERAVSILARMELLQGLGNIRHQRAVKEMLRDLDFTVLPLTPNIGSRAMVYIEEYGQVSGMRAADAIIAATAVENGMALVSGNARHFKPVKGLEFVHFKE